MVKPEERAVSVKRVLDRRGWKLATDLEQFAQSVHVEVSTRSGSTAEQPSAREIERATIHQYCFVLYDACAEDGTLHQRHAFEELSRYLYRVALFKAHDSQIAEECTQHALVNIWQHLGQCRDHGSFLDWCNGIVVNLIRDHFRTRMKKTETGEGSTWEPIEINQTDALPENIPTDRGLRQPTSANEFAGLENALRADLRRQLLDALRACLKNEIHEKVIVELFLNDRTIKQVAEELQTTYGNVQVMKSRALARLRECQETMRLYEEWLK